MKHLYLAFCIFGAVASSAFADLTVHLQSSFGVAATSKYIPHVVGNAVKPDVGATSSTIMKDEGDNWYSYTWTSSLSDFLATESFSIKACPEGTTSNLTCVDWAEGDTLISVISLMEARKSGFIRMPRRELIRSPLWLRDPRLSGSRARGAIRLCRRWSLGKIRS